MNSVTKGEERTSCSHPTGLDRGGHRVQDLMVNPPEHEIVVKYTEL